MLSWSMDFQVFSTTVYVVLGLKNNDTAHILPYFISCYSSPYNGSQRLIVRLSQLCGGGV